MDPLKIDVRSLRSLIDVHTIEHHQTLDSTNRLAGYLLNQSAETPLLVIADEQTAGRGRGGNEWWSPHGALLFSLVLNRAEATTELPPYSMATGMAVRDALQAQSTPDVEFKVKWPNDVYLEGRKVCGILIEVPPDHRDKLVIGVGININNSMMQAPSPIGKTVISMRDTHGHTFCMTTTLAAVVQNIMREVTTITTSGLTDRWPEHCWLTGKTVSIQRGDQVDSGRCLGINNSGAILLTTADGDVAITSGAVVAIADEEPA